MDCTRFIFGRQGRRIRIGFYPNGDLAPFLKNGYMPNVKIKMPMDGPDRF